MVPFYCIHVLIFYAILRHNIQQKINNKQQIQTISERLNQEFGAPIFNDSGGASSSAAVNAEVNQVENETMNIIDMMNRRMNNGTSTTTTTTISNRNNRRDNMRNNRNNNRDNNNSNNNNNNNGDGKDGKQSYRSQRGDPPPGYICHRCHVSGHWIQDCPTNGDPKYDKKNRAQTLRSNLPGLSSKKFLFIFSWFFDF